MIFDKKNKLYKSPFSFGKGLLSDGKIIKSGFTCPVITISPTSISNLIVGVPVIINLTSIGGTAPYTYSVSSGSLPTGLSLNTSTGVISGTPTTTQAVSFSISTVDSNGCPGINNYSFNVSCPTITISPSSISNLTVGQATTINLSSTGGTAPYSYAVTSGSLPTGLTLNGGTGVISGTPTNTGAASFQITSTDANSCTGVQSYSFNVNYEADAQAFITAAGITDTTQKNAINTLVVDLKGYGIWSKMKAIYPFVGGTASAHKWNLKDPRDLDAAFRLVFTGGWTHSSTGALPNGTNGYADTKLNASLNTTTTNVSFGLYSRTNNIVAGSNGVVNLFSGNTSGISLSLKWTDNNTYYSANNYVLDGSGNFVSDTRGLFISTKDYTLPFPSALYRNSLRIKSASANFENVPNGNVYLSARNNLSSGVQFYDNKELAFAFIGNTLNQTDNINLYTAVQSFQTTLGRSIGTQTVSDPDAQAFVTAANIQDQVQADAVNNLTIGLKADGLWNKMKAIYPFVGGDAASHKFNLKDPRDLDVAFRLVFNGGWTHSSNGAKPNGTNGYADTFLIPNAVLNLNSTHSSFYSRTDLSSAAAVDFGASSGGSTPIDMYARFNTGNMLSRVFSSTYQSGAVPSSLGLFTTNRQSSTVHKQYRNNTIIGSTNITAGGLPTHKIYLAAINNSGATNNLSPREFAYMSIGDGLTDTEAANLYSRVQTYQTALNRQV